jgi:hypothetical protein
MKFTLVFLVALLLAGVCAFAQTAGDYRSFQSGNWSDVNTWSRFNGSIWVNPAPSTPTSADGIITIMDTHTVHVDAPITVDQVQWDNSAPFNAASGTLIVDAGVTLTVANGLLNDIRIINDFTDVGIFQVDGTVRLNTGASIVDDDYGNLGGSVTPASSDTYKITSTGTHIHVAGNGVTAVPSADFQSGSTCIIEPANPTVTPSIDPSTVFHHFTWDGTLQSTTSGLAGNLRTVNGNLNITSTNGQILQLSTTQSFTLDVGGNMSISGNSRVQLTSTGNPVVLNVAGNLSISSSSAVANAIQLNASSTNVDINVTGDFSKSGVSQVSLIAGAASGTTTLDITGNFSFTGGTILKGNGASTGRISFLGSNTRTYTNSGGTYTNQIGFLIGSGKTLNMGTSIMSGSGPFTNNGTVGLGSTDANGALQTGATGGNIQVTGTRTYANPSTVLYNGSSKQFMGNGNPSGTGNTTRISNANDVEIAGSGATATVNILDLASGNLIVDDNTLAFNSFTTSGGSITVTNQSSITINGTGTLATPVVFSGTTLNNFTLNRTSSGLVTLGSSLIIEGTFTQTAGDLDISGRSFTINDIYSRTAGNIRTSSSSTLIVNGSGTLPATFAFGSSTALGTLTLDRSGVTLASTASMTITNLNLTDGIFSNGSSMAMAAGGTITRDAGTITTAPTNTTSAYNVVYTNSSPVTAGPELPTGVDALNNLTVQGGDEITLAADVTINGNLTLTSGSFDAATQTVTLEGNFVSNATSDIDQSPFIFAGTTALSGGTSPIFGAITISGTLNNSTSIQVTGNWVNNGAYSSSGTVTFAGTTTVSGSSTTTFNNIIIANSPATLTAPASTMNVSGNFTKLTGTFNANGGTVNFKGTTNISGVITFHHVLLTGTVVAPLVMNMTGNLTNNGGTFTAGSGTLVLSGSSIQLIQGTTSTTFNNLTVTNSAGPPAVRIETNSSLTGVLTLSTNTQFDADGVGNNRVFTLLSSDDAPFTVDAAIAQLPSGASVLGSVTVQRYMAIEGANNNRIYRYISSPVQSAPVSQLQVTIPVTGTFTGASTCTGCTSNSQSMFLYSEAVTTDINNVNGANYDDGYLDFPSAANSETLASGRGYAIYVRGNIAPVVTNGSALWSVSGPINSGTVDYVATAGVTFTSSGNVANDGWNLVGNPYPSTIDWDAPAGWTRTGLDNAIYMRDNGVTSPVYATYVGGLGANGGDNLIPIGQAFFVKSPGGPITFTSDERVKVAGQQGTFFREGSIPDVFRIALKHSDISDETVIRFHENATAEFDGAFDADKLDNSSFNLFSRTTGERRLAINTLPTLQCSATIGLGMSNVPIGDYQLAFSDFETFSSGIQFTLTDNFLHTSTDVKEAGYYSFQVTADAASYANRFTIGFSNKPVETAYVASGENICHGAAAMVSLNQSQPDVQYAAYIGDEIVSESVEGTGNQLTFDIPAGKLAAGDNIVSIKGSFPFCDAVIIGDPLTLRSDVITAPNPLASAVVCGSGSATLQVSGAEEGGSYRWYTSETTSEFIPDQFSASYVTPPLTESRTYFVSIVNGTGCQSAHIPVTATVSTPVPVSISASQTTLTSSYASGNQWYRDNEIIPGATGKTYTPTQSGIYKVVAQSGECTTSAETEFLVTSVNESPSDPRYKVHPIPTTGPLNVQVQSKNPVQVQLTTTTGRVVLTQYLDQHGSVQTGKIDMTSQPPGVYILLILDGYTIHRTKIVRE